MKIVFQAVKIRVAAVVALAVFACAGSAWAGTVKLDNVSYNTVTIGGVTYSEVSTWKGVRDNLIAGNNVRLTADVTHTSGSGTVHDTVYMNGKTATLDLNGFTLKGRDGAWMFGIGNSSAAHLTIQDSSVGQTGKIEGPINGWSVGQHGSCIRVMRGSVTLNSGTICNWKKTASSSYHGGAIWVDNNGAGLPTFTMNGGAITNCTCKGNGGAIYGDGIVTLNGGVIEGCSSSAGKGGAVAIHTGGRVSIAEGMTIRNCTASDVGGGLWSTGTSTISMTGGTIEGCRSTLNGGAIYCEGGAVTLTGGIIKDCSAKKGGAVACRRSGKVGLTIENDVTIRNCTATEMGGCVWVSNNSTFNMNGGTIDGCSTATGSGINSYGGAITCESGTVTLTAGLITGCSSTHGGAIAMRNEKSSNVTVTMTVDAGVTVQGCSATSYGGAAFIEFDGTLNVTINGGLFKDNVCQTDGGAFEFYGVSSCYIYGGVFVNNKKGQVLNDIGTNDIRNFNVYGGVFTIDPKEGADVAKAYAVGSYTVYAKKDTLQTTSSGTKIKAGRFSFNPLDYSSEIDIVDPNGCSSTEITDSSWLKNPAWDVSAKTLNVTLNTDGGSCGAVTHTYGSSTTLPVPTKTGEIFGGWYRNAEFSGVPVEAIGDEESENLVFWALWQGAKVEVTDDHGNNVTVAVSAGWMNQYGVTEGTLTTLGANGIPYWQSYVLRLDPNDKDSQTVVKPVQTSDATKLTLSLGDLVARTDAGVTVMYTLQTKGDTGSYEPKAGMVDQSDHEFNFPLSEISGVKYFRIVAKFYGNQQ